MKIFRTVILVGFSALLCSCSNSIGGAPKVGYSGFDNAKTVTIDPHGNIGEGLNPVVTGIGAQWNAKSPNSTILIIQIFNDIKAITGAKLNIDGKTVPLKPTKTVTNFEYPESYIKNSSKGFVTSIRTVENILSAKRVWLRVDTTSGYIEHAVVDNGKDSKAYHALKRFMSEVKR